MCWSNLSGLPCSPLKEPPYFGTATPVPETSPPKAQAVKQNKMQLEKPNWMAASQIAFLQRKVPHKPAEATVEEMGRGERPERPREGQMNRGRVASRKEGERLLHNLELRCT